MSTRHQRLRRRPADDRSLRAPTRVPIEGHVFVRPNGNMVLHEDSSRPVVVLLAARIGITPFRSMLEWATEQKLAHRFILFYSNRTRALTAFLDDLEARP